MAVRRVVSEEGWAAEVACRMAVASMQMHLMGAERSSVHRLPHSFGFDLEETAIAGGLLRIISVTEEFTSSTLIREIERRIPIANNQVARIWDATSNDLAMSWQRVCTGWKDLLDINVEQSATFKQLHPFIEARNAVTHGLGDLTRKQRSKQGGAAVKAKLASAGFQLVGNRIMLSQADVAKAATVAVGFIKWLDFSVQDLAI